ncbi:MAG: hypothetical protein HC872_06440 [Gammaproteobacteria bacterium]|nr:hypothetical protein [Gammaproteobacteria bacterium]
MDRDSGTLVSLLLVSVALLAAPGPASALTLSLSPSGGDDTAQLQAALDTCSAATQPCRIVLDRGVFHTDLLLVHDFRGRIRGQGAGSTVIRPLPDRQLRPTRQPFTAPASTAARYPVLLHFADGSDVELLDLTLDFPSQMQVAPWRQAGHNMWNTLHSAVLVDGAQHQRARLYVERVQVTADECKKVYTQFSNVMTAFTFGGQLRYRDEYHEQDPQLLGGGEFVVRASRVRDTGVRLWRAGGAEPGRAHCRQRSSRYQSGSGIDR